MNFAHNCNYYINLVIKFIEFHCMVLFQAFMTLAAMIVLKVRSTLSTSGKFNTCSASKEEREISRPISRVDLLVRFRRKDPKVRTRISSSELSP